MSVLKCIILTLMFTLITSCKAKKVLVKNSNQSLQQVTTNCPEDGVCTFVVIKNQSAEIKKDEFGATYLNLFKSENTLLKFEYKRNQIPNTQDSSYSEIIYVEIKLTSNGYEVVDIDKLNTKAIFGRLCFCRGQTGYYKLNNGSIKLNKIDQNTYNLNMGFKTIEVPQIITFIDETFQL